MVATIRSALDEAKKDLESGDAATLDASRQRVEQELQKVAEALYKTQTAEGAPGAADPGSDAGAGASPADDADVVDAEYTEETREN